IRVEFLRRSFRRALGSRTARVGGAALRHTVCSHATGGARAGTAAGPTAAAGAGWAGGGTRGPGRGGVWPAAGWHAAACTDQSVPTAASRLRDADQPVPVRRPG